MNSQEYKTFSTLVDNYRLPYPLFLSYEQLLDKSEMTGIKTLNYGLDSTFYDRVKQNDVTAVEFAAVYSLALFHSGKGVNYSVIGMGDVDNPKIHVLRLGSFLKKEYKYIYKCKDQELAKLDVSKKDQQTYTVHAKQYVAENYLSRVTEISSFLPAFISCFKIQRLICPNDGAGVANSVCLNSISFDPSPFMVEQALERGNKVIQGTVKSALDIAKKGDVFFFSHSESNDPGGVALVLSYGYKVIVYESSKVYPGYSQLYANGFNVRSSFEFILPIMNRYPDFRKRYAYYDMLLCGNVFYVSDYRVLYHMEHLYAMNIDFAVQTQSSEVMELGLSLNYNMIWGTVGVGTYLHKLDRKCETYYNVGLNMFHEFKEPVFTHNDYLFRVEQNGDYVIEHNTFGIYSGHYGVIKKGVPHIITSSNFFLPLVKLSAKEPVQKVGDDVEIERKRNLGLEFVDMPLWYKQLKKKKPPVICGPYGYYVFNRRYTLLSELLEKEEVNLRSFSRRVYCEVSGKEYTRYVSFSPSMYDSYKEILHMYEKYVQPTWDNLINKSPYKKLLQLLRTCGEVIISKQKDDYVFVTRGFTVTIEKGKVYLKDDGKQKTLMTENKLCVFIRKKLKL